MNILIVGNGLAGTLAARTLREIDPEAGIEILGEERVRYYPRPNLIEYLAGRRPYEKLFAFAEGWAETQRMSVRLGEKVVRLRPAERTVETAAGAVRSYDLLLLAAGARAVLPPVSGLDRRGVFALRTLDDANDLLNHLERHRRVAVLGGGLLGLEIARALRSRGAEVAVVEFFDRLLPRQLDPAAAAILKAQIEANGVRVLLGQATREVAGDPAVRGLRLASGDTVEAETVVVAVGIAPEVGLARDAGLAVGRGVVVDDRMRTSGPGIFAAGDAAEHRGRIHGIIPAAFEQARAAARNMAGEDRLYGGTIASHTLKVAGLSVTSVGTIDAAGPGFETLVRAVPEAGLYKKMVLRDGRLVGAIWMGAKKGSSEIVGLVERRHDVAAIKDVLLEDDFDLTEIP